MNSEQAVLPNPCLEEEEEEAAAEIKNRLNSGKACYHSVQSIFFFRLLSKT
jgi:hypothetical protein